jgi:hypothetical protein
MTTIVTLLVGCGGGGGGGSTPATGSGNYSISGKVAEASGVGIAGVSMALTGSSSATATTDTTGNYSFTGLVNGTYTLTPSKAGYTCSPASKAITVNNSDITGQDFVGSDAGGINTYSISGTINVSGTGLQGVTLTLNTSATATTDASGNYIFTGLANGSYTITPSKSGYTFTQTNSVQTVNNSNISGVNFAGTVVIQTANVAGLWKLNLSSGLTRYYAITQTGATFSGPMMCDVDENGPQQFNGNISGNALSFSAIYNGQTVDTCTGTVNGTTIEQVSCGSGMTVTGNIQSQAPTSKECVIGSVIVYVYQPGWNLQSHLYDPDGLVTSATLAGSHLSNPVSFVKNMIPNPTYLNRWWTPSTNIASGATPAFPLNYTVTINFADTTSQIVSQVVTTFD